MDPLSGKVVQEDVVQYKLFLVQSDDTDSQPHEERLKHSVEDVLARIAPTSHEIYLATPVIQPQLSTGER